VTCSSTTHTERNHYVYTATRVTRTRQNVHVTRTLSILFSIRRDFPVLKLGSLWSNKLGKLPKLCTASHNLQW